MLWWIGLKGEAIAPQGFCQGRDSKEEMVESSREKMNNSNDKEGKCKGGDDSSSSLLQKNMKQAQLEQTRREILRFHIIPGERENQFYTTTDGSVPRTTVQTLIHCH
jgi:hypothetical protein